MSLLRREYQTVSSVRGPLLFVERLHDAAFEEVVTIVAPDGSEQPGRVLEVSDEGCLVQALETTANINRSDTVVRPRGTPLRIDVSRGVLGRTLDSLGQPTDGAGPIEADTSRDVNGAPLNPAARLFPDEFIQTGISTIDGLNTMVRGQKLPLFSASGLPHNQLAAQIATQATTLADEEDFAVVFAAIGMPERQLQFFLDHFHTSDTMAHTVLVINRAAESSMKRLLTPRVALTVAEYLAFEHGLHVLVLMTDMTNYADALREVAAAREEIPGRRGYPAYMYSDFATLFERAGRVRERDGSVTQMPILTMPDGDITHPIPDLTGYITEGQIVLSRDMHTKGLYPPTDVLPSLSRHMDDGIGPEKTRADHSDLADQLYALYAEADDLRQLSAIIGEESLSDDDKRILAFAEAFEQRFVGQGHTNRSITQTLDLGWDLLRDLPNRRLKRVTDDQKEEHLGNA